MDIDDLVAAFAARPGAMVGRGPHHPVHPVPALTARLDRYFGGEYPGLGRDPGYVEFMWKYAGMSWSDGGESERFAIVGFGPATVDIDRDIVEEPMVDEEGYFAFAECVVHGDLPERPADMYQVSFGFDLTGQRRAGVYRFESTLRAEAGGWVWHAADFRALLAEAVANGGVWPRPDAG